VDLQCDLFGEELPPLEPVVSNSGRTAPLAAPCAFRNRANQNCLRLAHRPIIAAGRALTADGRALLHCPAECFNGPGLELSTETHEVTP
jgi:hypothetical protein